MRINSCTCASMPAFCCASKDKLWQVERRVSNCAINELFCSVNATTCCLYSSFWRNSSAYCSPRRSRSEQRFSTRLSASVRRGCSCCNCWLNASRSCASAETPPASVSPASRSLSASSRCRSCPLISVSSSSLPLSNMPKRSSSSSTLESCWGSGVPDFRGAAFLATFSIDPGTLATFKTDDIKPPPSGLCASFCRLGSRRNLATTGRTWSRSLRSAQMASVTASPPTATSSSPDKMFKPAATPVSITASTTYGAARFSNCRPKLPSSANMTS
mmetsp:Transcript_52615/g.96299  ORF Transcript_52615/g.96299 Transcript_52615/m.96299 type:complete len:273 (-) Transcript_52615:459-1277(-)